MASKDTHLEELRILKSIAERLNSLVEVEGGLDEVLGLLVKLLGLKTAWLFLQDGDRLQPAGSYGLPPALAEDEGRALRHSRCLCHGLYWQNRLNEAVNIVQCTRLQEAHGDCGGLVYHASVPLASEGERIGVLNAAAPGRDLFTDETLAILSAVGLQIGTAIARSRLLRRQRQTALLEERHRLAADLHDSVSQSLFSLVMIVRAAREQCARANAGLAKEALEQAEALAKGALSEMRALVFGLREADLADNGLRERVQRYIEVQPMLKEVKISLEVEVEPRGEAAETAFRLIQEGLNNVIKHAAARHVQVRVGAADGGVEIEVRDDGRGFDVDETRPGFGRRFLKERCEAMGGTLRVESKPGAGTRLRAFLPELAEEAGA